MTGQKRSPEDKAGRAPNEASDTLGQSKGTGPGAGTPPAGPHADPALTNPDATPGAGTLPEPGADADADAGGG